MELQPFSSVELGKISVERSQRKMAGFPSCFKNQTIREPQRRPAMSEDQIWWRHRENHENSPSFRGSQDLPVKVSKVSSPLACVRYRLSLQSWNRRLARRELPLCFKDLPNDVEIVFLRFFIDHALTFQSFQPFHRFARFHARPIPCLTRKI